MNNSSSNSSGSTEDDGQSSGSSNSREGLSGQCILVRFALSGGFMAHAAECLRVSKLVPAVFEFLSAVCADFAELPYVDECTGAKIAEAVEKCICCGYSRKGSLEALEFLRQSLHTKTPLVRALRSSAVRRLLIDMFNTLTSTTDKRTTLNTEQKYALLELLGTFASLQLIFEAQNNEDNIFDNEFFTKVAFFLLNAPTTIPTTTSKSNNGKDNNSTAESGEEREDGLAMLCKVRCLEVLLNHIIATGAAAGGRDNSDSSVFTEKFWRKTVVQANRYAQRNAGFPVNDKSTELFVGLESLTNGNQLRVTTALNSAGRRPVGPAHLLFDTEHYTRAGSGYIGKARATLEAFNNLMLCTEAAYLYTRNLTDLAVTYHMRSVASDTSALLSDAFCATFDAFAFGSAGACLDASNIVSNAGLTEVATLLNFATIARIPPSTANVDAAVAIAGKIAAVLLAVQHPDKMLSDQYTSHTFTMFERASAVFRCLGARASSGAAYEALLNTLCSVVLFLVTTSSKAATNCVPPLFQLAQRLTATVLRRLDASCSSVRCALAFLGHFVRLTNIYTSEADAAAQDLCEFDLGAALMLERPELCTDCEETREVTYSVLAAMAENKYFQCQIPAALLAAAVFRNSSGEDVLDEKALGLLTKTIAFRGDFASLSCTIRVLQDNIALVSPLLGYKFLPDGLCLPEVGLSKEELSKLKTSIMLNELLFVVKIKHIIYSFASLIF